MEALKTRSAEELQLFKQQLEQEYAQFKALKLNLNMARGKPSSEQLDLSLPLLDVLRSDSNLTSEEGFDCRNYGVNFGIKEARRFMGWLLDDDPDHIIVCGNASLNIMYDALARYWMFGVLGSTPWGKLDKVKWICPTPGYDRHFSLCEEFGIEMISVPLLDDGPDMDIVESLVATDASIKGIWCVPKYSNPSGITYSDETVKRLASMPCAAQDFRIFWDNAYSVHHLYNQENLHDSLLDIRACCDEYKNPDRAIKFSSTSKITFPGAGLSALASSNDNLKEIKKHMSIQTIGHDKFNQLRHVRYITSFDELTFHMQKHADLIRPKFELVEKMLGAELENLEIAHWTKPRGGYFVSFDGLDNTAKRTIALAQDAGVVLTAAGSTHPYKHDPHDSNIRIAPTLPTLEELEKALEVFICCVKLAAVETLL